MQSQWQLQDLIHFGQAILLSNKTNNYPQMIPQIKLDLLKIARYLFRLRLPCLNIFKLMSGKGLKRTKAVSSHHACIPKHQTIPVTTSSQKYEPPPKIRKPLFCRSNCWSFILIGSLLTCTVQSTQINRKTMLCHENYPNNLETNVL